MTTVEVIQKLQLVDGVFSASDAMDVINALIKEKINYHKLKCLSMSEGDMNCDISYDDGRVLELLEEKENFKSIFHEARNSGKKVKINGVLHIELID